MAEFALKTDVLMYQNILLALYVIQIYTMARTCASFYNIVSSFVNELNFFHFLRLLEFLRNFHFYAFW